MTEELFERPFYIVFALAVAELAIVVVWYNTRKKAHAAWLALPPLLIAGVFALAAAVETDREEMAGAIEQIAADLQAERLDAVRFYLDDSYQAPLGLDREGALDAAEYAIQVLHVDKINLSKMEVAVDGDRATMTCRSVVWFDEKQASRFGAGAGPYPIDWTIDWRKRAQGWRIAEARGEMNGKPITHTR